MKEILANPEFVSLLVAAMLIGALVVYLLLQRRISKLRDENTQLNTTLELERRNHVEKLETLERARGQLADTFSALSSQALKHNSEEFLKLAQENLKHYQTQASSELEKKEKAIEHLVGPIREALENAANQALTRQFDLLGERFVTVLRKITPTGVTLDTSALQLRTVQIHVVQRGIRLDGTATGTTRLVLR